MITLYRILLGLVLLPICFSQLLAYELSDILAAPYSGGLVSANDKEQIAWVTYEKGVRNIWTAQSPGFQAHQLTQYTQDDAECWGQFT